MLVNQLEHEERLLGLTIAAYTATAAQACAMLNHDDMSSTSTRWLLAAIKRLADRGSVVDLVTVETERKLAEFRGEIPMECNFNWLIEISKNAYGHSNILAHAANIRANAAMARAIASLDEIKNTILTTQDPVAAMKTARAALDALDLGVERKKPRQLFELAEELVEHRVAVYNGEVTSGMRLTVDGMSHAFGTIGHTDFIVIAGRPGSGKTELAVSVANDIAIRQGKAVLYKSLEMESLEVAERAILDLAGLSVDSLERDIFESHESGMFGSAIEATKNRPFFIDDAAGCTVDEVIADAKRFCAEHANVGAIIVDYVGLLEIGGKFSRHDLAIGDITRKLKLAAKELHIPIIGLFQLSRDVEKRACKRPVAADLRDSGSIEQDADKIVMVHRECVYDPNTPMRNTAELLNVKRRRGQPTNGYMEFKNGHFIGIPDAEQTKWRLIAEGPKDEKAKKARRGFDMEDAA